MVYFHQMMEDEDFPHPFCPAEKQLTFLKPHEEMFLVLLIDLEQAKVVEQRYKKTYANIEKYVWQNAAEISVLKNIQRKFKAFLEESQ